MMWINALSFAAVVVVNFLAGATTVIGGRRTGDVTKNIKTLVDPAPYAFSIWSLIYVSMAFFVWGTHDVGVFPLLCALNCVWLVLWGNGFWNAAQAVIVAYAAAAYWLVATVRPWHVGVSGFLAFHVFPQVQFAWVLCATTVSFAILARVHDVHLPEAVNAALLFVPVLVCRVLCHEPIALLTVVHALVAIHTTLRRRERSGTDPASPLVRRSALAAIVAALLSVVY